MNYECIIGHSNLSKLKTVQDNEMIHYNIHIFAITSYTRCIFYCLLFIVHIVKNKNRIARELRG